MYKAINVNNYTALRFVSVTTSTISRASFDGLAKLVSDSQIKCIQEAQLPQRNSASATHDYLGWSADLLMITLGDTMHRTQQHRGGCIIF